MRTLQVNEWEMVAGGDAGEVVAAVLGSALVLGVISAIFASSPPKKCHYETKVFTTTTKVYDPHTGEYLGDQIDTYEKPELVCY